MASDSPRSSETELPAARTGQPHRNARAAMGAAPLRRRGRPRRAAAAAVAAAGLALAALALFSGAYPTAISNVDPEAAGTDGAFAPDAVDAALAARDAALQRFVAARQANLAASLTTSTPLRERLRLFDRAGLTNANPPPCPVPYEWTPDLQDADVVVYDILRAGGGAAAAGARPGQRHALLSGESGKNYPVVWAAKQVRPGCVGRVGVWVHFGSAARVFGRWRLGGEVCTE